MYRAESSLLQDDRFLRIELERLQCLATLDGREIATWPAADQFVLLDEESVGRHKVEQILIEPKMT